MEKKVMEKKKLGVKNLVNVGIFTAIYFSKHWHDSCHGCVFSASICCFSRYSNDFIFYSNR